jgi:hypothetical protein
VPDSAWLTKVAIAGPAGNLDVDLAIDASGQGAPSRLWAGLESPGLILGATPGEWLAILVLVGSVVGGAFALARLAVPSRAEPA